jgi:hypothetical protein
VLLSSLLLEFRFRFGIVWGLFLGLVVRCDYATLANLCGNLWLCIWDIGRVLSLEKNFYRLPFSPPLSGHLIGPSHGTQLRKQEEQQGRLRIQL